MVVSDDHGAEAQMRRSRMRMDVGETYAQAYEPDEGDHIPQSAGRTACV